MNSDSISTKEPLASQPAMRAPDDAQARLLAWINLHDCGVEPTGVLRADGAIDIRCTAVARNGQVTVETETVHTYRQARDVLGY